MPDEAELANLLTSAICTRCGARMTEHRVYFDAAPDDEDVEYGEFAFPSSGFVCPRSEPPRGDQNPPNRSQNHPISSQNQLGGEGAEPGNLT